MNVINKSKLSSPVFSVKNKSIRILWALVWFSLFRFSPVPFFYWRCFVLKVFGADVSWNTRIYPSVSIWLPANLTIGRYSTLGPGVIVYNQAPITIQDYVIVSQRVHICSSTHDYNDSLYPLILKPIEIKRYSWVCAEAFIGPGAMIGEGSIIGARSNVVKTTKEWSVYGGNPATFIKTRERIKYGY